MEVDAIKLVGGRLVVSGDTNVIEQLNNVDLSEMLTTSPKAANTPEIQVEKAPAQEVAQQQAKVTEAPQPVATPAVEEIPAVAKKASTATITAKTSANTNQDVRAEAAEVIANQDIKSANIDSENPVARKITGTGFDFESAATNQGRAS